MMWDIGETDQHRRSNPGSITRMPTPALPPPSIAPSHYSDQGQFVVPSVAHSYSNSPPNGPPLDRAISNQEPHHHRRERRHSTSHSEDDRGRSKALNLLPPGSIFIKSSRHHKSGHHHSHSADNRHHHHHSPHNESSGQYYPSHNESSGQYYPSHNESSGQYYPSHSQSYAPAPTHDYQQRISTKPRIEHPAFHPQFMYSMCTGRKKALCIGVNYIGEPHELHGCINDAKAMRKFLIRNHGYKSEDIVLLTDDSPNSRSRPSRRNMIDAMHWLVQSARPHDSLFFHYSGHGGQTKDLDGDEVDGLDEVIFPMDFQQKGHIVDDDLFKIMVRPLPPGCRLTAIFDSCHSGTVLDLPFIYSSSGRLRGMQVSERARARRSSPGDAISFSACKDGQKSTDTFKGGVAVGAMSWAFCDVMARNPNQSYQHILQEVKKMTYPKYHQTPQLGSSHHIDMNRKFIL